MSNDRGFGPSVSAGALETIFWSLRSAIAYYAPYIVIVFLTGILFLVRLSGPSDLAEGAQDRQASYVLDLVQNNRWICQYDAFGQIASKPPLHTWLCGVSSIALDSTSRLALTLPSAVVTLITAWIVFASARGCFGDAAALIGSMAYLLSPTVAKQVALVRPDPTFALAVTAAALLAFRAWIRGRGWIWFWVVAGAATLTKGPLGLALASGGLLAALWEHRSAAPLGLRGRPWLGIGIYLLVTVAWLLLAWLQMGDALFDKLFMQELFGQAMVDGKGRGFGHGMHRPTAYLLWYFAPWSVLCCIACWRVCCRPADDPSSRRFERFLLCWILAGLVIFALGAHKRPDHLMPLIPAAAMLAGREMMLLTERISMTSLRTAVATLAVGMLLLLVLYYHVLRQNDREVVATAAMEQAAESITACDGFRLVHIDSPLALRVFLSHAGDRVTVRQVARMLAKDEPLLVALRDGQRIAKRFGGSLPPVYEVVRWPEEGQPELMVLSNSSGPGWPLYQPADRPLEERRNRGGRRRAAQGD